MLHAARNPANVALHTQRTVKTLGWLARAANKTCSRAGWRFTFLNNLGGENMPDVQ
jgi:hypothetical protein